MRHGRRYPIGLNDDQLKVVMSAAKCLSPSSRHSFLLRVANRLQLTAYAEHRCIISNDNLTRAVNSALLDPGGTP